jgi:hypothetical protein
MEPTLQDKEFLLPYVEDELGAALKDQQDTTLKSLTQNNHVTIKRIR